MIIDLVTFSRIVAALEVSGHAQSDIEWAENCKRPRCAEELAIEAIFVICNSGMRNTVARQIFVKVMDALKAGRSASTVFGHPGKARAIDDLWENRERWYRRFLEAVNLVEFCETLPYIGKITKFHLAKNLGEQVAKPDVHLQRLADREGCTAQALCERLAAESGYKVATVDVLLWRACATGVLNSRTGAVSA